MEPDQQLAPQLAQQQPVRPPPGTWSLICDRCSVPHPFPYGSQAPNVFALLCRSCGGRVFLKMPRLGSMPLSTD